MDLTQVGQVAEPMAKKIIEDNIIEKKFNISPNSIQNKTDINK